MNLARTTTNEVRGRGRWTARARAGQGELLPASQLCCPRAALARRRGPAAAALLVRALAQSLRMLAHAAAAVRVRLSTFLLSSDLPAATLPTPRPRAQLLYVAFNQDYGCFAAGTDRGFRIYHCEPFKETFKRDFSQGGIGIVEMLFRCNILALVGGGPSPRFAPHKVMIWDDHQNRCIGELAFRSDVKAVKLRRDRVVAALATKVYVYNFADLSLLDHIETCENPRGACLAPGAAAGALAAAVAAVPATATVAGARALCRCHCRL
jgi:hypothetical protein